MSNEIIFYTQIVSVVTFICVVFWLYRVLVAQKDATIELLKNRIVILSEQVNDLKSTAPDALAKSLDARVEVLNNELERLYEDKENNLEEINQKKKEIGLIQEDLDDFKNRIEQMKELMEDNICPHCSSILIIRTAYPISGYVQGREVDAEGEYVEYECGLVLKDGQEESPCIFT